MSWYKKYFKKNEADVINDEIMQSVFPSKAYENNRKLGYAQALHSIYDLAEKYIKDGHSDKLDADDLTKLIKEIAGTDKVVSEYFYRLKDN